MHLWMLYHMKNYCHRVGEWNCYKTIVICFGQMANNHEYNYQVGIVYICH